MKKTPRIIQLSTSLILGLGLTIIYLSVLTAIPIAVVHAANITVNSLADDIDDDGECTLREAINAANTDMASGATVNECAAGLGDDIIDLTGVNGTINLSSTLPTITSNIIFNGPGADSLTLDGGGSVRVFKITGGDVTISDLTIANGYIGPTDGHGGGIFNSSPGTVTVVSSTLSNNQAIGAGGTNFNAGGISGCCFGGGGGIFHDGTGILNLVNSILISNVAIGGHGGLGSYTTGAGGGGGAFGGGLFSRGGTVNIMTSVFSANVTIGGNGGDIDHQGNTTFSGGGGGGEANGLGGGGKGGDTIGPGTLGEDGNFGGGGGGGRKFDNDNGGIGGFGAGDGGAGGTGSDYFAYGGGGGGAAGLGGGIFNYLNSIISITDTIFINNQVVGGIGGESGYDPGENGEGIGYDIFNRGKLTLKNTSISNTVPMLSNYTPANGAIDRPLTQILSWNVEDTDHDLLTIDVAIGSTPNALNEVKGVISPYSPPIPLDSLTTYYWIITATDGLSVTSSGLLSFTTVAAPITDFDAAPRTGPVPLNVSFNNLSSGADSYLWFFGDGSTSTTVSPAHNYNSSGIYTVSLRATGQGGTTWLTKTNYITGGDPPQAGFIGAPVVGLYTLTTIFTDTSLYADEHLWDYGDGVTSTIATITHAHTYTSTGSFTVSLTASSEYGNDQFVQVNYINVYDLPMANFTATPLTGAVPLAVDFSNMSQDATDFSWTFGDGYTSTMVNPNHLYNSSGNYTVTLAASNPFDSNVLTRTSYITVGTTPIVDFYPNSTLGRIPFTVTFTNTSLYADDYLWDYGDGVTSTTSALTHTHVYTAPGYYTVDLTGNNAYGSDNKKDHIYVTDVPLVYFSAEPLSGLRPLSVTFTNQSLFADSYQWVYGDGLTSSTEEITHTHQYTAVGVYTVTLTGVNPYGVVSDTHPAYISVYDIPIPAFEAQPTTGPVPLMVTFTNSSLWADTYVWDFGDGGNSTEYQPTHLYLNAGQYTVTLTASNPITARTLSKVAYIQPYDFRAIATIPHNAEIAVAVTGTISVTFNRAVDANTVNTQNFTVRGEQTGVYEGTYSVIGDLVQFTPTPPFKPGENIIVNLSENMLSADGLHLIPHVWQFKADVGTGNGYGTGLFLSTGQIIGSQATQAIDVGDVDGDGDLDAVAANSSSFSSGSDNVWINDGAGNFSLGSQSTGQRGAEDLALGDLDGDGDLDAFVAHLGSSPNYKNRVLINNGAGIFVDSGQRLGNNNSYSRGVALGDLDSDGDLDAYVANEYGDRVWLNNGSGYFSSNGQSLGTNFSFGVDLGDVDGDGDLDAFVAMYGRGNQIWLNDGSGNFTDSGQELGAPYNDDVVLSDLDHDGDLDAFVTRWSTDKGNKVWFNDGTGVFIDSGQSLGNGESYGLDLGDVDGDGDLDAFVMNVDQASKVWFNDGSGNFTQSNQDLIDSMGSAVVLRDLDGDGGLDAFSTKTTSPVGLQVWLNQDESIIGLSAENDSPTYLGSLTTLMATAVAGKDVIYHWDFGDGITGSGMVISHEYQATGNYTAIVTASNSTTAVTATTIVTIWYPLSVTTTSPPNNGGVIATNGIVSASFNRTISTSTITTQTFNVWGKQTGIYTQSYTVSSNSVLFDASPDYKPGEEIVVSLNSGIKATDHVPLISYAWQFRAGVSDSTGIFYNSQALGNLSSNDVALGDLDNDGDLDAFVANGTLVDWEPNKVWLNNGVGNFSENGQNLGHSVSDGIALGDLDNDGDLDAFVANSYYDRSNKVWLNDGTGNFMDSGQSLGSSSSHDVALGDFDNDGDLDAFVANSGTSATLAANKIWLNDGFGTFTDSGQLLIGGDSNAVAVGDLDNDGDLDAFVANGSFERDKVWLNNGTGIFIDNGQNLDILTNNDVALGDFDDDGDLDAFVAVLGSSGQRSNKIWLNNGAGIFSDSGQRLGTSPSYTVMIGDMDGDGDVDAFVGNKDVSSAERPNKVWLNDGTGVFNDSGQLLGDSNSRGIAAGDLDGDGDLDAFVGNESGVNKVWLNHNSPIVGLSAMNDSPTPLGSLTNLTTTVTSGDGITYDWAFGDGATGSGAVVSHMYPSVGVYTTVVTASNSVNLLTATTSVTITQIPPMAISVLGGTVTPTSGVTITASGGVFSDTVLMIYTAQPITPTGTLSNVGVFYELSAVYLSSGLPAEPQPGQIYTIIVTYQEEDVPAGVNEADLALYYWDGEAWVEELTSLVDVNANTITATPDHLSLWAALADGNSASSQQIFLPIILKP